MTLYNRIFIFFIMMFAPIISSFADTKTKLSDEESQAMFQLIKSLEPNKPITLDLTQPQNEKGYIALLKSHNITEQTHPDIFININEIKKLQKETPKNRKQTELNSTTEPQDYYASPQMLVSKDLKLISTETFSSLYFPGSYISNKNEIKTANEDQTWLYSGLSMYENNKQVMTETKKAAGKEVRSLSIQSSKLHRTNLKPDAEIWSVVLFHGTKNGRSLSVNGTYGPILEKTNILINNDDILKQSMPIENGMHNKAPVRIKNLDKRNPLIVCLNRENPEPRATSECDYGPTSPGKPNHESTIKLEIAGHVTFRNPIAIDKKGKPTSVGQASPAANLTLVGLDTGGACKVRTIDNDGFWRHTKVNNHPISGNNTNLSWEFSKNTGYADFGPICWKNNERYVLNLMATIITTKGDQIFFVPFSYTNDPNDGTEGNKHPSQFIYPPIQIQYGCIAEGTLIDMADGSKRKVENIRRGDKVLTKQGGILQVKERITGHDTEFIDLIYNNGEQVSLTPTHPVSTLRGIVKADELKIGDTIHTRDGQTTLTSVKQRKSEPSNVYNFVLEKTDSQSELLPEDAVLFAGGILVGDNNLQRKVSISN
ncbi:Hint domain-containing protein [Photorhabdus tasmaniensis]|uniref:Hint domain-containing protein n=1 Tax=Photorhabdus tasmaniensis TaxID=1004159 RepID=A0ABX0GCF8_9GAMM|nr:Hint domain-containing protein [Photorhabdus tasmaniensis]NHB86341.1 hypothetical protein [Photorhabdus tasmaniensis]